MNVTFYLPLFVCIVGGLVYALTDGTKHAEIKDMGRISFFVGLLVFLFTYGPRAIGALKL